jgi:uncharacterized membrane protein (DUF4010 family)
LDTRETLIRLGISLGLGLLVGLQRERKGEELAGIRTFALITLFGTMTALVGDQVGPSGAWLIAAGALAVAVLMGVGGFLKARNDQLDIGLTTEVAALVMYGVGAFLAQGDKIVAVVVGAVVVLLLHLKTRLHGIVRAMGDKDMSAIMRFVLIALVILPLLPNQSFGPYNFFNPFKTWLVVVLIVSISFSGYILYKIVRPEVGSILGGAIGGLISSTATTVSYARRTKNDPKLTPLSAQAIMLANTVSVLRVMVLVGLFAGGAAPAFFGPLGVLAGVMAVLSILTFWIGRHQPAALPEHENPTELKSAVFFAALYSLVKLGTAWGAATFGASALYTLGALSGLTDVDAITLSMSDAAKSQSIAASLAGRVVIVAILSNLIFKAGVVFTLGNARLRKWMALLFGSAFACGLALLLVWKW